MKDMERIFKEALDQHEVPYQHGAWEAMAKRLDGTTPTPFYRKWWFAAAVGTVLVSSSTYFMLREQATKADQQAFQTQSATSSNPQTQSAKTTENHTSNATQNPGSATAPNATNEAEKSITETQTFVAGEIPAERTISTGTNKPTDPSSPTEHAGTPQKPTENQANSPSFLALSVPERLCFNETWEFTNPNDQETVYLTTPNGKQLAVKPGKTVEITANQEGTIEVISGTTRQEISVSKSNAKLYINIDSYVIFDNGIPTLTFKASGNENPVQWETSAKGYEIQHGDLLVHPYQDKQVTAIARTTDMNGCEIEEKTTIRIEQSYNLMAPTGFYPNDFDIRKNRFMPYALTKRNTAFEMIIVDPKNGGIVFQTNDATQGWDGIDKRTGEMVPENSVWPWRVILKQPNLGENKEYTGTITRL